jgi:hypothetical protein
MTAESDVTIAALWAAIFIWAKKVAIVKKRKNLGCMIKGTKERGAWAELYFMVLAMSQGLRVSSPYGGFAPYDVGVESSGAILRVQVKCTMYQSCEGSYSMSINVKDGSTGRRRGYARGTVDFFAVYIIPTDDWYILPYELIGERDANVYLRPGSKDQKYEKYREAWHLLLEACKGGVAGPIDIHACCGEAARTTEGIHIDVNATKSVFTVRSMFRTFFQRQTPQRLKPGTVTV